MEMDMQEPGKMCCCCEEEYDLAKTEKPLQKITGLHATVSRIIISFRGMT